MSLSQKSILEGGGGLNIHQSVYFQFNRTYFLYVDERKTKTHLLQLIENSLSCLFDTVASYY